MKSCSWLSFLLCFRTKKAKKAPAPPAKEEKPKLTIFEEEVDPDEGLFGPEKDFASVGTRRKMTESKICSIFVYAQIILSKLCV